MKKKRIIPSIAILMVLTAIMIVLTGCTTSEEIPVPTVKKDVYIYDEDNAIDDKVEAKLNKMLVELEDEGRTEHGILLVPNELFGELGIEKKEKYTQATEEKVKAVLNVLTKEYGFKIKALSWINGHTTSEEIPVPTVQNVYIKEDDNSSADNTETKMLVELEDEGKTTSVTLSVPNELFNKLGIEKKEKYAKATEEKVKAVLNVLAKEYNVNIKTFGYVKFVADKKDAFEIVIVLCSISAGIMSVIGAYNCYSQENRKIRARRR